MFTADSDDNRPSLKSLESALEDAGFHILMTVREESGHSKAVISLSDGSASFEATSKDADAPTQIIVTSQPHIRPTGYFAIVGGIVASRYDVEYVEQRDAEKGFFRKVLRESDEPITALCAVRSADKLMRRIYERELERYLEVMDEELSSDGRAASLKTHTM